MQTELKQRNSSQTERKQRPKTELQMGQRTYLRSTWRTSPELRLLNGRLRGARTPLAGLTATCGTSHPTEAGESREEADKGRTHASSTWFKRPSRPPPYSAADLRLADARRSSALCEIDRHPPR